MAKYQNLRSAIDFTEDEEEPITPGDQTVDPLPDLSAQMHARNLAALRQALESMGGKKMTSEEDLPAAAPGKKRKTHYSMDLREKPITGEMDLRDEAQDKPEMDLRSPRERADQNEAAFSKKKDVIGADPEAAANLASVQARTEEDLKRQGRENNQYAGWERPDDPVAEKLGYAPMSPVLKRTAQEDAHLVSQNTPDDEWDSIHKPAPVSAKAVPANEDWNTPYPDKSAKPVVEDDHDVIIQRGKEAWSNARGMIPGAEFDAMSPEDQAHYRKTHYLGPVGNWLKRDGEVPSSEDMTAGEVVSAGAQESQKPVVPSKGETPASSGKREIPSALLERLRAARAADAFNEGTSSLGRLLTSTAAQYGGLKEAPALLQDYLQKNKKPSAFAEEQEFAKAEKAIRDEEEEDSTETDVALVGQNIARQLGMPEEQVKRITGKSAKILIAMLGNKTKLDLQDKKEGGNTERVKLKGGYDITKEAIRSGDRRYAVDHRKAIAKALGLGKVSNDPKVQAKFDAEVTKLVHSLPAGFGSSLRAMDDIDKIIIDNDGEAPGVGPVASFTPDKLVGLLHGKDARRLRLLANGIYNDYIHNNFGTAFTGPEQVRFEAAMAGIAPGETDPEAFTVGLSELRDLITKKVEQEAAGRRDAVVQAAIERGLPVIPNSIRPALRGGGQGGPAVRPPPAAQTAPAAQRQLKKAGGKVYAKGANGDAVEVPLDQLTPEERQRLGV